MDCLPDRLNRKVGMYHPVGIAQAVGGFKMGAARELVGLQEVQQGPELLDAVLQGRASHQ